jgi:eukaryotic-like serine/threonine-protein kinase
VKVLDFGLAKAFDPMSAAGIDATASPTISSPAMMTGVGVLLGTAAYMSPEQARGKAVDKRSDIWAFGCVLYEMLTGKRAFDGDDVSDVLASVLAREPDWTLLPRNLSAVLITFLKRCLYKESKHRIGDIRDVRLALEGAFETGVQPAGMLARPGGGGVRIAAGAFVMGVALAGMAVWYAMNPSQSLTRLEVTTSGESALSVQGTDRDIAITPDGSRVVYRGTTALFVRALDQLRPLTIGPLDEPRNIFVSPDGQWIGFFSGGALKKVSITGGSPITVTTLGSYTPRGAAWGLDGTIVFATSAPSTGLYRVPAGGGDADILTTPDQKAGEGGHYWPEFLPDGNSMLFTIVPAVPGAENAQIAVLDLATGTHKVVVRGGSHAHYVSTGHLVYGANSTLRAVRFDLGRKAIVGTPVPVLEQVLTTGTGAVDATIAANGTLAYVGGTLRNSRRRFAWVDRSNGTVLPIGTFEPNEYENLRLSPDGRTLAVLLGNDVWLHDVVTGRRTRLTRDGSVTTPAIWHPTGSHVAYTANRAGSQNAWVQPSDGSGEARQVTKLDGVVDVDSWSPNGQMLAVHHHRPDGGVSMLMLKMMNEYQSSPEPFVEDEPWAEGATFSPDGRYVAYMSRETDRYEVYIRAYPRSGGKVPVSVGGGREALWARTGELFYRSATGDRMWAVPITTEPTLEVGNPKELFVGRYSIRIGGSPRPLYDATRDGQRFVMLQDTDDDGSTDSSLRRIVVVQNWTEELKRLLSVN